MAHNVPSLETPRLVLWPIELADAPQIQAVFPQWEIVKYLNRKVPWPFPANGAETFVREMALPAMERGDGWFWTIRRKNLPGELIGVINLRSNEDEHRGFWLDPRVQGQGYMTEACDAVTHFWFEVLKFPLMRVAKALENTASQRISEEQGMRVNGAVERDYVCGRLPAEIWEITAEEWRARKARMQKAGTRDEQA
jgi:[ribosomal protein S5]-alanine N-acetyltransferase